MIMTFNDGTNIKRWWYDSGNNGQWYSLMIGGNDVEIMMISNNHDITVDDIKWYNLLQLWGIERNHHESMVVHSD